MVVARGVVANGLLLNRLLRHLQVDDLVRAGDGQDGDLQRIERPAGIAVGNFRQKVQRVRRDGIKLKKISFPVPPPSMTDLAARLLAAITPATRVLHFCHITNLTGQIFPVKQICDEARRRGIKTIVDGAHAFAQFPFTLADLGCDFYGTSLHKWLLAPIGTGFLYVRRDQIAALWPLQPAAAEIARDTMAAAAGLVLASQPPLLHFSARQDVVAWGPSRIG